MFTQGGHRGASNSYFVPYLSAIQIFASALPTDVGGTSRLYVSEDNNGWPRHMHLKFEYFEHELPFNRLPLYDQIELLSGTLAANAGAPSTSRGGPQPAAQAPVGATAPAAAAQSPTPPAAAPAAAAADAGEAPAAPADGAAAAAAEAAKPGAAATASASEDDSSAAGGEQPQQQQGGDGATAPTGDSAEAATGTAGPPPKEAADGSSTAASSTAASAAAPSSSTSTTPASSSASSSAAPSASGPATPANAPTASPSSGPTGRLLYDMRLVDVHPASWFAVAWYPVYRIPDAPLYARFLTFHSFAPLVTSMQNAHERLQMGQVAPYMLLSLPVRGAVGIRRSVGAKRVHGGG